MPEPIPEAGRRKMTLDGNVRQPMYPSSMALGPDFTSMNVSLPKDQKAFVEERVARGGFGSVSDYVRELIRRDQREHAREALEQRLLAALESPRSEMTPGDWKELRDTLIQRHGTPGRRE